MPKKEVVYLKVQGYRLTGAQSSMAPKFCAVP